jgi:prepilin-type processing-associated H-X9-DG protein
MGTSNNLKQMGLALHSYADDAEKDLKEVQLALRRYDGVEGTDEKVDPRTEEETKSWLRKLCATEEKGRALRVEVERMSKSRLSEEELRLLSEAGSSLELVERETATALRKGFAKLKLERSRVCPPDATARTAQLQPKWFIDNPPEPQADDVNHDGQPDVITGPGAGGADVEPEPTPAGRPGPKVERPADAAASPFGSRHSGGMQFLMGDGSVRIVSGRVRIVAPKGLAQAGGLAETPKLLEALATGQPIEVEVERGSTLEEALTEAYRKKMPFGVHPGQAREGLPPLGVYHYRVTAIEHSTSDPQVLVFYLGGY